MYRHNPLLHTHTLQWFQERRVCTERRYIPSSATFSAWKSSLISYFIHTIYQIPLNLSGSPPLLQYIRTRHALTSLWNLKQFIVTSQRHVNPLVTSSSTGTQDSKRLCQEICGNEKWRGFCSVRAEEIHLTSNPAGPRLVSSEMLAVPNTWDVPDVRSSVNTIHLKLGDEGAIN